MLTPCGGQVFAEFLQNIVFGTGLPGGSRVMTTPCLADVLLSLAARCVLSISSFLRW